MKLWIRAFLSILFVMSVFAQKINFFERGDLVIFKGVNTTNYGCINHRIGFISDILGSIYNVTILSFRTNNNYVDIDIIKVTVDNLIPFSIKMDQYQKSENLNRHQLETEEEFVLSQIRKLRSMFSHNTIHIDLRINLARIIFAEIAEKYGPLPIYNHRLDFSDVSYGGIRFSLGQFKCSFLDFNIERNVLYTSVPFTKTENITVKPGDIVKIKSLKSQNNLKLNQRVKLLNNSFGIIMDNVLRLNKKNQTEYLIYSMLIDNLTIGIRPKYLRKVRNLHIHDVSKCNIVQTNSLFNKLLNDSSNIILYASSHNKEIFNSIYLHNINNRNVIKFTHLTSSLIECMTALANVNYKNKQQILNTLTKLHLICDNKMIIQASLNLMLFDPSADNKRIKNIRRLQNVFNENYLRFINLPEPEMNDISITRLQIDIEMNIQTTLSGLLNVNDVRHNRVLWKDFFERMFVCAEQRLIELRMFQTIHPKSWEEYDQLASSLGYKENILSDIVENYFINKQTVHVIVHNIGDLKCLQVQIADVIKHEFNTNIVVANILAKEVIKRYNHCT